MNNNTWLVAGKNLLLIWEVALEIPDVRALTDNAEIQLRKGRQFPVVASKWTSELEFCFRSQLSGFIEKRAKNGLKDV